MTKPLDQMTPPRWTHEAYKQGCLCYAVKVSGGWEPHHPDACPLHGWRPDATPERIAECEHDRAAHLADTMNFMEHLNRPRPEWSK